MGIAQFFLFRLGLVPYRGSDAFAMPKCEIEIGSSFFSPLVAGTREAISATM
jgi:hypothetical protein